MPRQRIAVGTGWTSSVLLLGGYAVFLTRYVMGTDGVFDSAGDTIGKDFVVLWTAATGASQGRALELFQTEGFNALLTELFGRRVEGYPAWTHPPPTLLLILPLAHLPYLWALAAWLAPAFLLYAYLARTHGAVLICAPSTFFNAFIGQTGFLIGAIYLGALRLLQGNPVAAGACLGLLAVKPHLGLMAPVALVAARAHRALLGFIGSVVALSLLSALAFGWESWRLWLTEALPRQAGYLGDGLDMTVSVSAFGGARVLGLPPWAASLVQAPCTAFAVGATWWAFARLQRGALAVTDAGAILLLATCLATPYIMVYDLTLASLAALYGFACWRRRAWVHTGMGLADLLEAAIWSLVWLAPFLAFFLNSRGLPVGGAILAAGLAVCVWRGLGTARTPLALRAGSDESALDPLDGGQRTA